METDYALCPFFQDEPLVDVVIDCHAQERLFSDDPSFAPLRERAILSSSAWEREEAGSARTRSTASLKGRRSRNRSRSRSTASQPWRRAAAEGLHLPQTWMR